eukprot:6464457-Amphidinium_carterae.1
MNGPVGPLPPTAQVMQALAHLHAESCSASKEIALAGSQKLQFGFLVLAEFCTYLRLRTELGFRLIYFLYLSLRRRSAKLRRH